MITVMNVGDKVKCLRQGPHDISKQYVGQIGVIQSIGPDTINVEFDTGCTQIGDWVDFEHAATMFEGGDHVECIKLPPLYEDQFTVGMTYIVKAFQDCYKNDPKWSVVDGLNKQLLVNQSEVQPCFKLFATPSFQGGFLSNCDPKSRIETEMAQTIWKPIETHKCTCDIRDIMTVGHGCKCGGV